MVATLCGEGNTSMACSRDLASPVSTIKEDIEPFIAAIHSSVTSSGMLGLYSLINLCVMERAAFQEICWPLREFSAG